MSNLSLRLIILTMTLFFYQTSYAEIQANLLGHWTLDETTGTVANDSSGNANDGTVRNATGNPWAGGNINGALGFDGTSDVSVPTTTSLQPSSLSLSAWVNLDSGNDWSWIAGEGDNFGMLVEQGFGGTWLYFYIHNGSTWVNAHANNLPISDQQWHHLVGTFDEATGEIKVYVDGSQVANNIVSGAISYSKRSGFHIGSMDGQRQFNGSIDDVRLYGQVLTQSEVAEVSDGGGTGGPNNQAPTVLAGSDSNTLVDIAIALNGSVTDDGLPINSNITSLWTKVSGPGDIVFSEINNPSSTATFSAPGDYVLSLTATDGDLSSSDEINITVVEDDEEQNQAPSVSAGADQSTLVSNSINLEGTTSDDGLPAESIVSTLWSKVSGPGNVTFSDPTNTSSIAVFSTSGTYILSLTATDGDLSSADEITIIVNENAVDINQAPTVSAGADQDTLITDSISLSGSASDDGLPAESILSTQWIKVSGPGIVTFGNENSAVTNVIFSVVGTYVLRLSATDGELTSSDESTVTVTQNTGGIDITTGLLGHWPLDETAGTNAADVSGNGNNGSVRNNTNSSWQAGQLSGALTHDGNDDDVSMPATSTLQPSSLTVSSWVKPSDKNDWGWIAGEGDNFGLYVDQGFGGKWLYFYIYNGSTWVNAHVNNVPIFDGQWHHVAATFDEATGEIKVYADSVEVASSLVSGSISYNRGSGFHIGSMTGRRHFKGSIDDVRLYGRVLDQASIAAVSGDGTPPTNENSAPVVENRDETVDEDSNENIITLTATDADGDDITFPLVGEGPTNGSLTINGADFVYTPNADFSGTDSFSYKANDGTVDSTTATVTITVTEINDAPTTNAGPDVSTEVGVAVTITGSGSDIENDQLTYNWSENGTEIASTASFSYTPTTSGEHTLTLTVSDGAEVVTDELTVNATVVAPSFEITFFNNITVTTVPRNLAPELFVQGLQLIAIVTDGSGNPVEDAQVEFNVDSIDLSTPGDYPLVFTYPGATPKTLTVRVFNIAPQATGDSITVDEDSSNNPITLVGTDSNTGDTLTYSTTAPAHGSLAGSGSEITYTPTANFAGTDEFTFTVSDGIDTSTATIHITVTDVAEPNEAPVVENQTITVVEDSENNAIALVATDANSEDILTFTVNNPANGTLTHQGANVVYKPNANFSGTDSFTYKVNDGTVDSNTAAVTIEVTAVNDIPVANELTLTVVEDSADNTVLLEGTDEDSNDTLSFTVVTQPTKGTLSGVAPNLTYSPNLNFAAQDSFTYKVNDGTADSATVTVTINVSGVNDAPVVEDIEVTIAEDSADNAITLVATDVDENDTLTYSTTPPSNGTLTQNGANVTYTPTANFAGDDEFTFTVSDGTESVTATVHITVTDVAEPNEAPIAEDQPVTVIEDSGNNTITLVATDTNTEDTLTFTVNNPANGTLTFEGANVVYKPNDNFSGTDSFTFKVNDGTVDSNTATVTISVTAVNDNPIVQEQTLTVAEDSTDNAIILEATDDDSNDTLSFIIVSQPSNGELNSDSAPNVTYTPTLNFAGEDAFTYKVNDGTVDSTTVTVTINVSGSNDTPVAQAQTLDVVEDSDNNEITLVATDNDTNDTLSYILTDPENGTLSGNAPDLTYKPNANFFGVDTFTFKVNDGLIDSETVTVTINVSAVNDIPEVEGNSLTVTEDSTDNAVTLVATDDDAEDVLSYTFTDPENGSLSGTAPSLLYAPNENFEGTDTFTFSVNDGTIDSETVTVTINVSPVNDTPTVVAQTLSVIEDSLNNVISLEAADVDSTDVLSYSFTNPENGSLSGTAPALLYTPNENFNGTDTFTFSVNDGTVDSATVAVSITVTEINDIPVTTEQTLTFEEDSSNNPITLEATDIEDNDSTLGFSTTEPAHGDLGGTGASITYTPDADYFGPDSFIYTATDSEGATSTSTINITVTDVEEENQPPVATGQSVEFEEDSIDNLIVLSGDDPDGDNASLTYTIVSVSAGGTFVLNGQNFVYTPSPNFHGIDEVVYTVSDGDKVSDPATILITITDINDPPQNVSAGSDVTVAINESVTLNGVGVDHDGESVSYSWAENGTTIAATASFDYTPTSLGLHTLTFTVTDDDNESVSDTLIVDAVGSTPDSIIFNNISDPLEIQAGIYSDINDLYERALRGNVVLVDQNGNEYNNGDYELIYEGYAEDENDFDTQTPGNYIIYFSYEDDFAEFFIEAELRITVTEVNNDRVLIMPLGDSITAGDGPGDSPRPSYRRDLWHALSNTGYNFDFVGSEHGYTNTTISTDLQDFDPDYEAHPGRTAFDINNTSSNVNVTDLMNNGAGYTPDIALIHLGTNDLLQDGEYIPEQDDQAILNSLAGIISQIKAKNNDVVILLAQIIPIDVRDVSQLNAKVKQLFENTAGVVIVDQQSGFVLGSDTFDGIHASASGEQKMADRWYKALIQLPIMGSNFNTDADNDGVTDLADAFPLLSTETIDSDSDGIGNNADTDDDNDGFSDVDELAAGTDPLDPASFPDNEVQAPFLQAGFISNFTGNFDPNSDQSESRVIRTYASFSGEETSQHDFNVTNSGGNITSWTLSFDSTRAVPMQEIVITNDDYLSYDHGTIPGTEFDVSIDSNTGIVSVVWPLSFIQGVDYRIDIEALEATITGTNAAGSSTRTINIVKPNGINALDHRHDDEGGFQCEPGRPHSSIGSELGFFRSRVGQLNNDLSILIDNGEEESPEAQDIRAQISDAETRIAELEYMLENCPDGAQ